MNGLRKMLTLNAGLMIVLLLGAFAAAVIGLQMGWWAKLVGVIGGWFWLVLLLLLVAAGAVVLLWWLPRYREQHFLARLQSEEGKTPEEALEENRTQLREKMLEAIGTLQHSPNLKQGSLPLYVLPWYLLLGASQSGKTTLLQGVAHHFTPFVRPPVTTGDPTPNCDWWFFNTAIILDTSSRYALPIQVEHDSAEWYRLLQLLKHYRPQQPINGLLIAVAADTLAAQAPEEIRLMALELRKRMDEMIRELGVDAPIYLLITRCDLIEGFTEFFGCLPEQTLKQVFGFMNETRPHDGHPQPDPASASHCESMLTSLVTRLYQLRLSIYNQEKLPPVTIRQKVFCFPEEFSALQQPLSVFVETVFAENPVQRTPFFRGLFFCSAQQQGTPFSFVRRTLSFESQSKPLKVETRTYFLHDLFAVLLPRERYLVRLTVEARRSWLLRHLAGFVACMALCLLLIVLLSWAFVSDRAAYASANEAHCALAVQERDIELLLDQMDSCRQVVQTLIDRNHRRPAWSTLVSHRSSGHEAWLRQRYVVKFEAEVLTPLDTAIGQRLTTSSEPIALVFLLFKRLDLIKHCLSEVGCPHPIREEMHPDYQLMLSAVRQRPVLPEQVAKLENAYAAYLCWSSGPKEALHREQEVHANHLRHWFAARQLALPQILLWANQYYPPVTSQEYWEKSPGTSSVQAAQVAGAYTRAAWEKSIRPLLHRAPEAGSDMQPLLAEVVAAYRTQFFDQWQRFLADFPRGESSWAGTHESRRRLALKLLDTSSPYTRLLEGAFTHLQLLLEAAAPAREEAQHSPSTAARDTPRKAIEPGVPTWVRVLSRYVGSENRKAYLEALKETGPQLAGELTGETSFQLARAGFQEGRPLEKSTHPLLRAWWIVDQFRKQEGSGDAAEAAVFWPLLLRPLHFVWNVLLEETGLYLQERWHELLLEVKDLPVGQKHEVLYGKGGKVAAFVSGPASAFLERRGEAYLRKRLADAEVAFTDAFLLYLKHARVGWQQPEFADAKRRVQVFVAPADIQAEGDVKVARTELILDCDTGRQSLGTPNARGDFPFIWTVKGCFNTAVRISLSDASGQELASLERRYPGFPQFLEHFSTFQQVFRLADFTVENSIQLAPYRIRAITLRYRFPPEARQQLVKDLEAYKHYEENLQARLELPAKIVATSQ